MYSYSAECPFRSLSDIKGKKVTVMGLGLNGGGEASVRFFARYGAEVTVTDMKTAEQLAATIDRLNNDPSLADAKIRYVLGHHDVADFENADCVIKNPGVKIDGNRFLAAARAIESDISIFLRFSPAPVIAVTGSKGKSSTVSAIHFGLREAGWNAFLGGNITVSPLTFFEETSADTPVVLELSSWQLADLRGRGVLKPKVCVLTKIVPDHQNWYGNMESYVADKKLIYADQTEECYTVCAADEDWGRLFASETRGTVAWYSKTEPSADDCCGSVRAWIGADGNGYVSAGGSTYAAVKETIVPGAHMKQNMLNAALAIALFSEPGSRKSCEFLENSADIFGRFPGIAHRLEFFCRYSCGPAEFRFYNDSAATVPEAVAEAVCAFDAEPVLLCGGTDKNLEFEPLAAVAHKARARYILAGSGTDKLIPLLREKGVEFCGPFESLDALLAALKADLPSLAQKAADSGLVSVPVVFSPGATSFGMFANEFDRGNQFKTKVSGLFV